MGTIVLAHGIFGFGDLLPGFIVGELLQRGRDTSRWLSQGICAQCEPDRVN
jgi:hypothetical protein